MRVDATNTAPVNGVDFILTHAAQPANVDFVMIGGAVHKGRGRLTTVDLPAVLTEAQEVIAGLRQRAGV